MDAFGFEGGGTGTGMSLPPLSLRERKSQVCSCGSWHCSSRVLRDLQDRTEKLYWANPPPFPMVWRTYTEQRMDVDEQQEEEENVEAGTSVNQNLDYVDIDSNCSNNDEQDILVMRPEDEEIQVIQGSDSERGGLITFPLLTEKDIKIDDSDSEGELPMVKDFLPVPSNTGVMVMRLEDEEVQVIADSDIERGGLIASPLLTEKDISIKDSGINLPMVKNFLPVPSRTGVMVMRPEDEEIQVIQVLDSERCGLITLPLLTEKDIKIEDSDSEGDLPMVKDTRPVPSKTGIMVMRLEDEEIQVIADSNSAGSELITFPLLTEKDIKMEHDDSLSECPNLVAEACDKLPELSDLSRYSRSPTSMDEALSIYSTRPPSPTLEGDSLEVSDAPPPKLFPADSSPPTLQRRSNRNLLMPHKCKFCGKGFSSEVTRSAHEQQICHLGEMHPFHCSSCNRRYASEARYLQHVARHRICQRCGRKMKNSPHFMARKSSNKTTDVVCSTCKEKEPDNDKDEKQEENENADEMSVVVDVKESRPNSQNNNGFNFRCKKCGKGFQKKKWYELHLGKHRKNKNELWQCETCLIVCGTKNDLREHVFTTHQEEKVKCPECGKHFAKAQHLAIHMVVHSVSEKFRCSVCNKMFGSSGTLKTHQVKNGVCSKKLQAIELKKIQKGPMKKSTKVNSLNG